MVRQQKLAGLSDHVQMFPQGCAPGTHGARVLLLLLRLRWMCLRWLRALSEPNGDGPARAALSRLAQATATELLHFQEVAPAQTLGLLHQLWEGLAAASALG